HGRGFGADSDPVRVLCARGAEPAPQHRPAGPAEPQPAARHRGRAPYDVRSPAEPLAPGRDGGARLLRRQGLRVDDPAERAARGGAELRAADRAVRRPLQRCRSLSRPRAGSHRAPRALALGIGLVSTRPRLGKGLGALLGEYLEAEPDPAEIRTLPISAIVPNPLQPRTVFTDAELADLAASIQANGLLQPLVVRPAPDGARHFQLIAGERRFRAVKRLGWTEAPVIVREASDETLLVLALVENLQRE